MKIFRQRNESLADRAETARLRSHSECSLRGGREGFLEALFEGLLPLDSIEPCSRAMFFEALLRGGYSDVQALDPDDRHRWLENYVTRRLLPDLRIESDLRKAWILREVLTEAARESGKAVNKRRLSDHTKTAWVTLDRYWSALEAFGVVDSQPGWTEQSVDRPMATPKYYMTDSGLAAYLQGLDREEDLSRNTECVKNGVGSLTATWVYNQLRSEINRHASWEFSYLRTRKHDINFIVANEVGRLLAVKVKATESVMPNDYKDLHWFARLVGEDNCRGVVLYAGHRVRSGGQSCYALPMSALWSDFSTWEKW